MTIAIAGLGLIGGSMARAFKAHTDYKVLGYDRNAAVVNKAIAERAADGELNRESIAECDIVIVALYPRDAVEYIEKNADTFKKGAIVIDCCGIKRYVCERCFKIAAEHGFEFYGGHPMAGTQFSGFDNSKEDMFKDAYMIIVPPSNAKNLDKLGGLFSSVGFKEITVTDAATHDAVIAFTSQLAHVVSNAYVKSPSAMRYKGFSAGSFKDLTRVAKLNETMWTELFLENGDFLTKEIDRIAAELKKYSDAIKSNDANLLKALLKDGRELKEMSDRI